jgi:hypothetical protein
MSVLAAVQERSWRPDRRLPSRRWDEPPVLLALAAMLIALLATGLLANRSEVSGDLARHARLKGDPPRRTMTLGEARQLVGALVTRWLDWLRESSDS